MINNTNHITTINDNSKYRPFKGYLQNESSYYIAVVATTRDRTNGKTENKL
jgi:hypothetical protein